MPTSVEERLRFLTLLLDAVEQAVIASDVNGQISYWNRFAERLYGWSASEVMGKNIADVLLPDSEREAARTLMANWPEGAQSPGREWVLRRRDGTSVVVQTIPTLILDETGRYIGMAGVSWDISERRRIELERKRTEEELRRSEWQLREAQRLAHVGSWERDMQTNRISLSDEGARIFFGDERKKSVPFEELVAVVHPDDSARAWQTRNVPETTTVGELEFRIVKPDGSVRRVFARAYVVRDDEGRPVKLLGTHLDITERHRAETELREKKEELQALSRRLLETQETERRLLARELHDTFGQLLTAIRLNLHALGTESDRITESIALINQANDLVRNLALELRPSILDDLGLEAALRWLLNRQSHRARFAGSFTARRAGRRLPAAIETCCFRLAQEALTNVARHARAQRATIDLDVRNDEVTISIRDDGQGFDVRAGRERAVRGSSLGLLSMEERVSLAGGRLDIQSRPGFGTTVLARFPLAAEGANEHDQSSPG